MSDLRQFKYLPRNAKDPAERVAASFWGDAPARRGVWVVPLDGGPRRIVRINQRLGVWREQKELPV